MEVQIFEEHSSVLSEWWERQARNRTLVCFDAHLDLQFINADRLARLAQCATRPAIENLQKPHHLSPDAGYSYGIEDFLHAARHLGLIRHLIWVAPPHVQTSYSATVFGQLQQMEGVSDDDLETIRRDEDGRIHLRLFGLEITICRLEHLSALPLPADVLLDFDIDYFVATPGDLAWANPREVFHVMEKICAPEWVTISRSVRSGFTPLGYRFIADHLAALFEQRDQDAQHYERLFALDQLARQGDPAALEGCREELGQFPDCAATYYLMSLLDGDPARSDQCVRRAAARCAAYESDLLRRASEFPNRQLPVDARTILSMKEELDGATLAPEEKALTHAALGLICCGGRMLHPAVWHYQQCVQELGPHPELALEIGQLLLGAKQLAEAMPFLEVALRDDKTRCVAHVLLGQLALNHETNERARVHLAAAHDAAPAWTEILPLLAEFHRRCAEHETARAMIAQYERQQARQDQIAARLGRPGGR